MKHLIVGAGASFAQARDLGNAPEECPPLIRDFARKTWSNYTPHPILEAYLHELGHEVLPHDPRELFYQLEEASDTNIERFIEYVWQNREKDLPINDPLPPGYISLVRMTSRNDSGGAEPERPRFWDDLLYHGIGDPIVGFMAHCFFENGKGWRDLQLSKLVAAWLEPSDLVLNLNYDTVFELALSQHGMPFSYAPNRIPADGVSVCKPHGSLNLVSNATHFAFGQPNWLGMPQPPGHQSYSGIIPPRLNKRYEEHPISKMILAPALGRAPQAIAMWGVGLAESDIDSLDLYQRWARRAEIVDIVNPSPDVAARAKSIFRCEVRAFESASDWIAQTT